MLKVKHKFVTELLNLRAGQLAIAEVVSDGLWVDA